MDLESVVQKLKYILLNCDVMLVFFYFFYISKPQLQFKIKGIAVFGFKNKTGFSRTNSSGGAL